MAFIKNKEAFYGRLNCNRNVFIHICEMLLWVIKTKTLWKFIVMDKNG